MSIVDQAYHDDTLNTIDNKYYEAIILCNKLEYIYEDVALMQKKLAELHAPNHARAYRDGESGIFIRWQLSHEQIRFMYVLPHEADLLSKEYNAEYHRQQAEFMINNPFDPVMQTIDKLPMMDAIDFYKFLPLFYESLIVKIATV